MCCSGDGDAADRYPVVESQGEREPVGRMNLVKNVCFWDGGCFTKIQETMPNTLKSA